MADLLTGLLAGIQDETSLARMAGSFNSRAELLCAVDGDEARVWSDVYRLLALSVETALVQRRNGLIL